MSPPELRSDADQRRARIAAVATVAAVVAVLATVWFTRDEVSIPGVLGVLALGLALGATVQIRALAPLWDRVGFLVSVALIASLVWVTGGAESNYQDLFLIPPLVSALLLPGRAFAAALAASIAGAFAPALYDQVDSGFLADVVADAGVWAAAGTVVYLQVQRRRQQEAQLRETDELKSAFLQATSHELRTPLTVIHGFAKTLAQRDRLSEEQQRHMIQRLIDQSERLTRLVTDLLDVDRLMRGAASLQRQPVDLSQLVLEVIAGLGVPDRVQVEVEPVTATVDAAKIERVVENLVANALKHAGPEARVWVRVEQRDGSVVLTVEDDGVGVPESLRGHAFEPFRQGPESARAANPGTGIGLALVHRFVALHGGRVWIEARPGGGARFVVAVPDRP